MRRLRTVRISVTGRCDLDCTYCNAASERSGAAELSADEIARIAAAARIAGARTVRLTGGEPLMREDLEEIVGRVRSAGVEEVALTTNAQALSGRARSLREAGLDRVNIGLPSLRADSYRSITGGDVAPALGGLDAALDAGFRPVKVNVVVMKGANDAEIGDFVELARARPVEVRFIEHMPFAGTNNLVPAAEIREAIAAAVASGSMPGAVRRPTLGPAVTAAGGALESSPTAAMYRPEGFAGRVGVISPMTEPFCERCDRLRVTSEGRLRSCLSEPDEIDLRALLERGAGPEELAREFAAAFDRKPERHSASFSGAMRKIGG